MVLFSLTIVRHGETQANRDCLIQGQSDFKLNELGREQADLLGRSLASSQQLFSHCFASDLSRAHDTAKLILKYHVEPLSCVTDKRLRERSLGVFENLHSAILHKAANDAGIKIEKFIPEGGESATDVHRRVVIFFADLCRKLDYESLARTIDWTKMSQIQTDSELPTPKTNSHSSGGSLLISNRRSSSRKVSRSGNLSSWPEELCNTVRWNDKEQATFYIAGPSEDRDELFNLNEEGRSRKNSVSSNVSTQNQESCDSGIADDVAPLTVDTELTVSALEDGDTKMLESSSSSGGWSILGLSPKGPTTPTSPPLPFGNGSFRKFSMQSIASDDSCFPDLDAQVLIVSHGGPIKELLRHFCDDFGCVMPGGKYAALSVCPNTGISTFMVSVEGENISITCLELHSILHLGSRESLEGQL